MGMFQQGHNAWRIERAERVSVLIDAGAFFGRRAKRSNRPSATSSSLAGISIAARDWSAKIAKRMTAGRSRCANFLTRLVDERPASHCPPARLGLTPSSTRWSASRFLRLKLGWNTPSRVRFRARQRRAGRLLAASEDHRGRRCGRILRRARSDDPPLGYLPSTKSTIRGGSIPPASPIRRFTTSR